MILAEKIFNCFKNSESFSLQDAYEQNLDKPQETVRARIYEKIGVKFERVAKGVYRTIDCEEEQCVLIEGNGRDLSMIEDNSIDCILTDHPWLDMKSNKGGTRAFALYDCFRYTFEAQNSLLWEQIPLHESVLHFHQKRLDHLPQNQKNRID